jgi:hypothetical protein
VVWRRKSYALVKSLKEFRDYVFHSKILAYVPTSAIKDILIQPDSEGKRGKWIAKIQEYDVEIKPYKISKRERVSQVVS